MKKLLMTLGTISVISTSAISVVACSKKISNSKIMFKYDVKNKLIIVDLSQTLNAFKNTPQYKEKLSEVETLVQNYNKRPVDLNKQKIDKLFEKIDTMKEKYLFHSSSESFKEYVENYGSAIKNHPDAIGILIKSKDIWHTFQDDNGKKSCKLFIDKEDDVLSTFNFRKNAIDNSYDQEIFNFKNQQFIMPKHGVWKTAKDFIAYSNTITKASDLTKYNKDSAGLGFKRITKVLEERTQINNQKDELMKHLSPLAKLWYDYTSFSTYYVNNDNEW